MIGNKIGSFKMWCQKVLPLVYDDSLSYYECLCKLTEYLNEVINQINMVTESEENFQTELTDIWEQYKTFIDNYFESLSVQNEINNKLDEMAENGTLTTLLEPFFSEMSDTVENNTNRIDGLSEKIQTIQSSIVNPLVPVASVDAMTDSDKLYILTTNGALYYWNGNSFVTNGYAVGDIEYYYSGYNTSVVAKDFDSLADLPHGKYFSIPYSAWSLYPDKPTFPVFNLSTLYVMNFNTPITQGSLITQMCWNNFGEICYRTLTSIGYSDWLYCDSLSITSLNKIVTTNEYGSLAGLPTNSVVYINYEYDDIPFAIPFTIMTYGSYSSNAMNGRTQLAINNNGDVAIRISTSASYDYWYFLNNFRNNIFIPNEVIVRPDYDMRMYAKGLSLDCDLYITNGNQYSAEQTKIDDLTGHNNTRLYKDYNVYAVNTNYITQDTVSGLTNSILIIGDSITRLGGYLNQIKVRMEEDGNNFNFLGSFISTDGVRNEGRGSWSIVNYYSDSVAYNDTNAFYNPDTKHFDFNYYLQSKGYTAPDMVLLALGTNDTNSTTYYENFYKETISDYQFIINNIKSYVDKVAVWAVPPNSCLNSLYKIGQTRANRFNNYVLNKLTNCDICYNSLLVDPKYGYNISEIASNAYTDKNIEYSSELHHFGDAGNKQLGDAIYTFILRELTK